MIRDLRAPAEPGHPSEAPANRRDQVRDSLAGGESEAEERFPGGWKLRSGPLNDGQELAGKAAGGRQGCPPPGRALWRGFPGDEHAGALGEHAPRLGGLELSAGVNAPLTGTTAAPDESVSTIFLPLAWPQREGSMMDGDVRCRFVDQSAHLRITAPPRGALQDVVPLYLVNVSRSRDLLGDVGCASSRPSPESRRIPLPSQPTSSFQRATAFSHAEAAVR